MDAQEQIQRFQDFLESNYKEILLDKASRSEEFLVINFQDLAMFDLDLAELLLEEPENTIKAAEYAVAKFDLGVENVKFNVRFKELPESSNIMIRNIRAKHIDRLFQFKGIVRQKSDVRPQVTTAEFECPSCGNRMRIYQVDAKFREPSSCSCGRKGKFHLVSKELVDAQKLVVEEASEDLDGGEQPKRINVFLKNDLVSPISDRKTNPGSKIKGAGILKEVPITLPTGGKAVRFDLMIEANYLEPVQEEFTTLTISPEEQEEIIKLSKDPEIYDKLLLSIAPTIYGHERIKEALLLQLFGGRSKKQEDGVRRRGDIHILLIGDPGCIAGDSKVALMYKGMERIDNMGQSHGQKIREVVTKIRKGPKDKGYDFATVFQHYPSQPVLKLTTETGKEIVCTYNQPFLTKDGWKRADEIPIGEKIKVMPKIPNNVKKLASTGFIDETNFANQSKEVTIPKEFTEDLAGICGYIIGDGHIRKKGYEINCYVNEEEKDLIEKLTAMFSTTFDLNPSLTITNINPTTKQIHDSNGLVREIITTQKLYLLSIYSVKVASALSFLINKRVPQQIFKSPNKVVSNFISWLFDADGCTFSKGRGRTSVQLKSTTKELLRDVQLLLLYFGIQSRIIDDNLCIRRSRDIKLYAKHIGFNSEKKKQKLKEVLKDLEDKSDKQKRKTPQRYEEVASIISAGIMDVYDFEVPKSHCFIANGIVCHNSGKSQLLKRISVVAPKARFVSGKGASGAGLTAAVVRDEFLRGWALEAGALVLANRGIVCIDELDKMSKEDTSAMHEALEQQQVSISKANIQATLLAETTVLAAANPKFGRFDPYELLFKQIDLPSTLINRFDLIFPVKDLPNQEKDDKLATFILNLHKGADDIVSPLETKKLTKYIGYAKQNTHPVLTEAALAEIKNYFVNMRNSGNQGEKNASIPISARQLEGLVRLSEASAKTRLSQKVTKKDAQRAIDLLHHCLSLIGLDIETGKFDIDIIATGITASQRGEMHQIKEIISELEKAIGNKLIPMDDLIREAEIKGIPESKTTEVVDKLKRAGDLYSPKHGFITRI